MHTGALPLQVREQEAPLSGSWSRPRRKKGNPGRDNSGGPGGHRVTSSFLCPGLAHESEKLLTLAQLAWLVLAGVGYGYKRNDQAQRVTSMPRNLDLPCQMVWGHRKFRSGSLGALD